jgi:TRAP-type mannitol/chloroaromatic compound transport system permease large subunit
MICVNVQTSFMHPPFGFALFYLRSVAPKEVKSSDIYWGSVPWVILQLIMVFLVIAFPHSVTFFLDKPSGVDPAKVKIEIQAPPSEDAAPPVFK